LAFAITIERIQLSKLKNHRVEEVAFIEMDSKSVFLDVGRTFLLV